MDQYVENETVKDKPVLEEPVQQEIGKHVMTLAMLTRKQCLLQQRCAGCTTDEPDPGENPTNQE
eukprot:9762227-Ditylum_brightwellii.AAC.1